MKKPSTNCFQSVGEFRAEQDGSYTELHTLLAAIKDTRQQETSAVRHDLASLSARATDILAVLDGQAHEGETQDRARINKTRELCENHRDGVAMAAKQLHVVVATRIDELRVHAQHMEENISLWADKVPCGNASEDGDILF